MIITDIELCKYIPFEFSGILRLSLKPISKTIVIQGANGAGKSSLLRECTPLPASRPDYRAEGYKRIKVSHGDSEYVLFSDFTNKTSPHSFKKDEVELNVSGTTGVQNELIEKYLGYTSAIANILNGKLRFATMAAGERKSLLLELNPHQLGFMITEHKKIVSYIRACQNNLTRLYERKIILEGEFLNKDLEDQLTGEHNTLTRDLVKIIEFCHRLTEQISQLEQSSGSTIYVDLTDIKRIVYQIINRSSQYIDVPRYKLDEYIAQLKSHIIETETLISSVLEQIRNNVQEVNRYSQYAQDDNHKELAKELKGKIEGLQKEIDVVGQTLVDNPFDKILLKDLPKHCDNLTDILNNFVGCGEQLQSPETIERYRAKLEKYFRKLETLRFTKDKLDVQIAETEKHMFRLGPDEACVSTICPLLLEYRKDQEMIKKNYDTLQEEYRRINHRGLRCSKLVELFKARVEFLDQYTPYLNRLSSYFGMYAHLRIPIRNLSIISVLRIQPFNIVARIRDYYDRSIEYYKYHEMKEQLDLYVTKYTQITSSKDTDREFIQSIIKEKQEGLITLRDKHGGLKERLKKQTRAHALASDYQRDVNNLIQYQKDLIEHEKQCVIKNDVVILKKIKAILDQEQTLSASRLGEITRILRDQETLRSRYDEEIMKQIEIFEEQKAKLSHIERALSPNSGIPHRYMVQFINALIATANYFISRVFSYSLELIPISFEDMLTYKFSIKVGEITVPDISTCSDAQKEMIDIAFMLALIVQLKLTDYAICPDEWGRCFDVYHKQRLLELLTSLVDEGVVSQIFIVNHDISFSGGLINTDVVVLNSANILVPEIYNTTVEIELQ